MNESKIMIFVYNSDWMVYLKRKYYARNSKLIHASKN